MAELTREQQKALALAKARQRAAQAQGGAPEQPRSILDRARGVAATVGEGMTFGYGDEAAAAIEAALGDPKTGEFFSYDRPFSERYQSGLERKTAEREEFVERNPVVAPALEIGGAVATGAGLARGGATLAGRAATLPGKVGLGAAEGALYGAAYGSGKAEPGDRVTGALMGAGTGAATGGALTYGGQKVVDALTKRATVKAAPSTEMLRRGADAAYGAARAKNPQIAGFDQFAGQARQVLTDEGFHPRLHSKLRVVLDEIEKLGPEPDFKTLEKVRRMARAATGNFTNPDEQRLGKMLVGALDDFVQTKAPLPEVKIGRELYGRFKRGAMVEDALESAVRRAESTGSGGNVENAMRQNIRRILDSPKKRAGFSKAETEAMEEFVRGGKVQNFLRLVGKLSPQGSGLMAALGLGGTVANPWLAIAPATGMAAKSLADAGAKRQAGVVSALTRSGGKAPPYVPPYLLRNQEPVVRALSGYSGGQVGAKATRPR